jgi:ABC-type uncharacterized transport system permease subunit
MKQKNYFLLRAWLYAIGIVSIIVVSLSVVDFKEIDSFGIVAGIILLLALSFLSYSFFKKARSVTGEEKLMAPAANSSASSQITYYQRMLFISIPAFILLSVWIFFDLNNLESGNVDSIHLLAPIAWLYRSGGYWLAVLATPVLGILVTTLFIILIRKLKQNKDSE